MREDRRSLTAEGTAALRAAHLVVDEGPPILDDSFAARLLGASVTPATEGVIRAGKRMRERLLRRAPAWANRFPTATRRLRTQIVVRSRYAEDRLEQAVQRGVRQYVVLAAGLDTFGLRSSESRDGLVVYEVDHPKSQEAKRDRLRAAGLGWPAHVVPVPIDFEREDLAEVLSRSGHDRQQRSFFSWLGVTYYLSPEAIAQTLRWVAEQPSGSEITFDFWSQDEPRRGDRALLEALRFSVRGVGEEMVSFFTVDEMRAVIEAAGLFVEDVVGPREADRRYLAGRRDGLRMPDFAFLASARAG